LAGIIGGDIVSAAEMFSKAMSGQFEMFTRLGIRIEKTGTQTEQLNALMLQLAQKGGGVLEAQSKTLTGQWQQLTNSVSDLFRGHRKPDFPHRNPASRHLGPHQHRPSPAKPLPLAHPTNPRVGK
jgi:hypothetical protein